MICVKETACTKRSVSPHGASAATRHTAVVRVAWLRAHWRGEGSQRWRGRWGTSKTHFSSSGRSLPKTVVQEANPQSSIGALLQHND
jgi:hypothetical protein